MNTDNGLLAHGTPALLVRGKKRHEVIIVTDHHPFPAVTVKYRKEDWIVGRNELLSTEQIERERQEELQRQRESMKDLIEAFTAGHKNVRAIATYLGCQMVDVLSRCRKAERLGFIALEKSKK